MLLFPKIKYTVQKPYGGLRYKSLVNNMVSFFLHKDFKAWRNNFVTFLATSGVVMSGFQAGIHGKWHTKRKHESRGRHQPIRDKLTSDVQVKLELVNIGVENVAKTQKKLIQA